MEKEYPIKEEWKDYYFTLEAIRRTGVVNMWGAAVYLKECYSEMTEQEAGEILCNWISNYDKLNAIYNWRPESLKEIHTNED